MESLSPALVLTVAEEWPLYRPSHPTAGNMSALAAEALSGLRKWSRAPGWTVERLWFLQVNTQLRKAPFSALESLSGPGSILLLSMMPCTLLGLIFPSQEGGLGHEHRRIHAGDGIAASAVPVLHLRLQVMPLAPPTRLIVLSMGSHIISS